MRELQPPLVVIPARAVALPDKGPKVPKVPPAAPVPTRAPPPQPTPPAPTPIPAPPSIPTPVPMPMDPTLPNTPPLQLAANGSRAARTAQLADTELMDDPRGGWRFRDPADQAALGADADAGRHAAATPDAPRAPDATDAARAAFGGDAQHPPQGHLHAGTQGTWDDALLARPY